jgi:flagellar hook-associated protein 1 FlgK
MSGIFSALNHTAKALEAQQFALEIVGQNIANVNTPGYTRRVVDFAEVPPADRFSPGGVRVDGVRAVRDTFTEYRIWGERTLEEQQSTMSNLLDAVQAATGLPGQSIDGDLNAFFDSFAHLAENPTSSSARQSVIAEAQALGASFDRFSDQLNAVRVDADRQLRASVDDINQLATTIANLNRSLNGVGGATSPGGLAILDKIYDAVGQLAGIVAVDVIARNDGQLDVSYAGGRALVVGGTAYSAGVVTLSNGFTGVLASDGTDVTSSLTGGRVGGLLRVRDTIVPDYLDQLDTLAWTLVDEVNSLHLAGYDMNGVIGGDFFVPIAAVSGASAHVAVADPIVADPTTIAAAGGTAIGDNATARAIAALRDSRIVGGASTLAETWGNLVYRVGTDSAAARQDQQTHGEILRQLQALRDSASAVSIDEEASMMLKFQRAYQANARFFQTVNLAIDTLLNMV